MMTFTPAEDLLKHIRFSAEFEDGSSDVFAVPEAILRQGYVEAILLIAEEWQDSGFLREGWIVAVRPKRFALN